MPCTIFGQTDLPTYEKKECPDIIIKDLKRTLIKRKKLMVQYTIENIGSSDASLFGVKKSRLDNVVIRAYFSGDKFLNRGDVVADASYIFKDISKTKGQLAPGETYTYEMRVVLKERSNHIGIILLKLDAMSTLTECDETNNVEWMYIK